MDRGPRASNLLRVMNLDRGTVLANRVACAQTFLARLRGLMGTPMLPPGAGLLLQGDNAIHTCFMRFAIDVAFLDDHARVLDAIHELRPWRISRLVWRASAALELPAGTLARSRTQVGDRLTLEESGERLV